MCPKAVALGVWARYWPLGTVPDIAPIVTQLVYVDRTLLRVYGQVAAPDPSRDRKNSAFP